MSEGAIRVALVDDDKDLARHMRGILESAGGFHVVRVFSNAADFLKAFPDLDVNVVLMDINMPGQSGIECIAEAKPRKPGVEFVVLTVFESPAYVFQALRAGATGYVVKHKAPAELVDAVREVHAGGSPMSRYIARLVVNSFQEQLRQSIGDEQLTAREKEVLDQLAGGLTYKEIAAKAGISVETVRRHVHSIYTKLQVSSRHEAVRKVYPGQ